MLKIKEICKKFDKKIIFEDFNFEAKKGEFITILGENGAGKSTLMNIISGSIFVDSGQIIIDENDVTFMPEHKRSKFIGRVFQDPLKGTAPNLTIEENLSLAILKNSPKNLKFAINHQNVSYFKENLSKLHMSLEERLNTKVGLLSGGQRQALTLIMATICKPKILLLDEHTAALDPKSQEKILNLTEEITNDPEITTIMITHNMEIANKFNKNIINLSNLVVL